MVGERIVTCVVCNKEKKRKECRYIEYDYGHYFFVDLPTQYARNEVCQICQDAISDEQWRENRKWLAMLDGAAA